MQKNSTESKELYTLLCQCLNSISEFIYQSVILEESSPSLASLSEAIALSELKHYRLLSHVARMHGIDHKINFRVKNSFNVPDSQDPLSLFSLFAEEKRERAKKYSTLSLSPVFCQKCSATLASLADDERSHCEMILSETDKIKNDNFGNNKI